MKSLCKDLLAALFLGLILPGLLLNWASMPRQPVPEPSEETEDPREMNHSGRDKLTMKLLRQDGSVSELDMDDYLTGVVLAEMPASFEPEALKAQAVVARTYTLRSAEADYKHTQADVCTDHTCCQAYVEPESYSGGASALDKVYAAVKATSGEVLTYGGELIEATYFSCSGGSTEDAVAVWGTDYPYLRATESPGEENAAYYTDTIKYSKEEIAEKLGFTPTGPTEDWFGFTTYTAGGGVNTMRIGGRDFSGTELRVLLGLRSTAFSVSVEEDQIIFTTKGFGHRVGMSQYGADAMALAGHSYLEILAHYYQGTSLENFVN